MMSRRGCPVTAMGPRMLGGELALEIRVVARHGKGVRQIAREVGIPRNTVRRYLRDPEAARYRPRLSRPGELAAFEGYIAEQLAAAAPDVTSQCHPSQTS